MESGLFPGGLESDTPTGRSDPSHSTLSASPTSALHRIRLGPPWELTPLDGQYLHTRRFGRPRTLDHDERVWLVWLSPSKAEISVNGEPVGTAADTGTIVSADITNLLKPGNELRIAAMSTEPLTGVALEIRKAVPS